MASNSAGRAENTFSKNLFLCALRVLYGSRIQPQRTQRKNAGQIFIRAFLRTLCVSDFEPSNADVLGMRTWLYRELIRASAVLLPRGANLPVPNLPVTRALAGASGWSRVRPPGRGTTNWWWQSGQGRTDSTENSRKTVKSGEFRPMNRFRRHRGLLAHGLYAGRSNCSLTTAGWHWNGTCKEIHSCDAIRNGCHWAFWP